MPLRGLGLHRERQPVDGGYAHLLPTRERRCAHHLPAFALHPRPALLLQVVLFGLWHLRAFVTVPLAPAAGIILATTVPGIIWGLQTRRDGTMVYAAAQHALFLALL